jgi:hypothetical protein
MTRKEGLTNLEKEDIQKLNRISHMRYKEQKERGYDIITTD